MTEQPTRDGIGARVLTFARSVLVLAAVAGVVPWLLVLAARERFGGAAPFHGVPAPTEWGVGRLTTALGERLTESTVADVVVRVALVVAWLGVVVFVVTVVAEAAHMARHGGIARPDVRGLGPAQHGARAVAAGLLVIVPLFASPAVGSARSAVLLRAEPAAVVAGHQRTAGEPTPVDRDVDVDVGSRGGGSRGVGSGGVGPDAFGAGDVVGARPDRYVVRAGDSVFGIAERLAGPETSAVAAMAERLLDLNLGRTMHDGRTFDNAAFIDVGWVLDLPAGARAAEAALDTDATGTDDGSPGTHVVARGETLWSIADDELDDPARWPEIYDANTEVAFADGGVLTDPDVIRPGWTLTIPGADGGDRPGADDDSTGREVGTGTDDGAATAGHAASDDDPARVPIHVDAEDGLDRTTSGRAEPTSRPDAAVPSIDAGGDDTLVRDDHGPADVAPGDEVAVGPRSEQQRVGAVDSGEPGRADSDREPAAVDVSQPSIGRADGRDVPEPGPLATARRDVVWDVVWDTAPDIEDETSASGDDEVAPALLLLGGGAMLSAGVLALLAVRRRRRLRRASARSLAPPSARSASVERVLRTTDTRTRSATAEGAVRLAAPDLVAAGSGVLAVPVAADGSVELLPTTPVAPPAPWRGDDDRWQLGPDGLADQGDDAVASVPLCPTLVQLGVDDRGRHVFVDLEAMGALEVGGPGPHADAIVAAIAATLASSVAAEATTLVGCGVPHDAFLGHRRYVPARDVPTAFRVAAAVVGTTASAGRSTFGLRCSAGSGDTWEPAVVLVGSSFGTVSPPAVRTGLAVVSAAPVRGPSARLAPSGDAWELQPSGIRLTPVGLTAEDAHALAELVGAPDGFGTGDPEGPTLDHAGLADEHTIVGPDDDRHDDDHDVDGDPGGDAGDHGDHGDHDGDPIVDPSDGDGGHGDGVEDPASPIVSSPCRVTQLASEPSPPAAHPPLSHDLVVRLFGEVSVTDVGGEPATFEKSKARELLAWMVTHRERSTRSGARAALWELDVRDATFSNVVSDARRSLGRLVDPPVDEEWVGRTMTDALPLHPRVVSDAELIRHALDASRSCPTVEAIETLRPAVDLIAGLPFAGTAYLWPDGEGLTTNLVLLATSATAELASRCLAVGDVTGVFDATARGLQVLPGHEALIGLRMQAHGRSGDRAGVRREWEVYERVINADAWSDGEPSPKLVELRHELLGTPA